MAIPEAEFIFRYHPEDREQALDAYDAATALYGIARSLSIFANYSINGQIIKQAPALKNARVIIKPPAAGSFDFISVIQQLTNPGSGSGTIIDGLTIAFVTNLAQGVYNRLTGRSERTGSRVLDDIARRRPGELDALADAVEEDVTRLHRPMMSGVGSVNIFGNGNSIVILNQDTYDYVKSKVLGSVVEEFIGHVTSLNGNTLGGRLWVEDEERTVAFSVDRKIKSISGHERSLLSQSLDQWVQGKPGTVKIVGYPLRSKQGLLKRIFLTNVLK